MDNTRVQFILKRHPHYGGAYYGGMSSGLQNSARFVSEMLVKAGIESKVSVVQDNNDIDREVSQYKPTHVIIEALWVVPEKFEILHRLHPQIQWIIRTHSEVPFLALEGIAIDWIKRYTQYPNVSVAVNSLRTKRDLEGTLGINIAYLPNYYPLEFQTHDPDPSRTPGEILIGCFGAIRPMKNQLLQAVAAMNYANNNGLTLYFFINTGRVEQGESVLKNLRALFEGTPHQLEEIGWESHGGFLNTLAIMDLAMFVSFTETFSLASADAVSQGVPTITSSEVSWTWKAVQANPTDAVDIERKISRALRYPWLTAAINQHKLKDYSKESRNIWLNYLGDDYGTE